MLPSFLTPDLPGIPERPPRAHLGRALLALCGSPRLGVPPRRQQGVVIAPRDLLAHAIALHAVEARRAMAHCIEELPPQQLEQAQPPTRVSGAGRALSQCPPVRLSEGYSSYAPRVPFRSAGDQQSAG
jgi:hypothetical protein